MNKSLTELGRLSAGLAVMAAVGAVGSAYQAFATRRDARRPTPPLGGPTPAPPTDRLGPSARRRVGPACGNPRRGWKGRAAWTLASRAS